MSESTQLDAVRVLTGIVRRAEEAGLPRLSWDLRSYDGATLTGQTSGDDDAKRTVMEAWAVHFGVEPTVTPHERYTSITVRMEVDGVRVEIFTHTDQTHTYIAVPRDQAGGAK